MADTSAENKRELLMRLLRERAAKDAAVEKLAAPLPLRAVERTGAMELSFGQERIWVLEQLQPESLFYNILLRFGLNGPLDTEALRRSVEAVVARHEILRATFPSVDGRPVQNISPVTPWVLRNVDLRQFTPAARELEERRVTVEEAKTRFDLATGPLLRTLLVQLGDEEHVLVLTIHHIISDGWSIDLLFQELLKFYAGFASGAPVTLPALPIQYADFASWQRKWLTGKTLESRRDYWKKKLAGPLPSLDLPFDRSRSAARTFHGATRDLSVGSGVLEGLRELSRREGVTLYTTMLTALQTLLHRYSGQDDLVVGTLVAGRMRTEVESLMGFFVNTLALRCDLSGDPSFREAMRRTRDVVLEAHANADFPFEKLVAELRPERDLTRSPFFQVVFNMLSYQFGTEISCAGLRICALPTLDYHSVTDGLTLFAFDRNNRLDLTIVYNPGLFNSQTIARLEGHFSTLLAGIVSDPDQRLSALPLLGAAERTQLLALAQGQKKKFPSGKGYAEYFEDQVRRTPDATAVADNEVRLSYAQLNDRANRVARALLDAGVAPGEPVALCSERGATLLSWILAVFKAGAAYLPLDPRHPPGRHTSIILQSSARIALVADALSAPFAEAVQALPESAKPRVFSSSALDALAGDAGNPKPRAEPGTLAYIIFTSGSTGSPKGAMVHHSAMLNHFWSKIAGFELGPADVVVQSAPIGFDISVWQFLAVLLAGGCVRVAPDAVTHEPERLFEMVRREGATLLEIVPSFLRVYLDSAPEDDAGAGGFGRLRRLVLGGEALTPDLCRRWFARWPATAMVNGYGPSECADDCARYLLATPPGDEQMLIPIGRPIHNACVHILDRALGLLPVGVAGELCIGGANVGLGYLNDAERTATAFVSDPYGAAGARLYRTGDRARMRDDGIVEFLGRVDHQVKIRGHRIELGEIESVLGKHPQVRQAVVHAWSSPSGDRLAAYVVPNHVGSAASGDDLRAHLRKVLPLYMVPEAFVTLEELPLNANGKVNRRALPAPTSAAPLEFTAPRTPIEAAVAKVWAAVLGHARVGVHDNFFELGGHSLLAAQAAARLRVELQVDLAVRVLFEKQTVEELAEYLAESQRARAGSAREELTL